MPKDFRLVGKEIHEVRVEGNEVYVDGERHTVELLDSSGDSFLFLLDGKPERIRATYDGINLTISIRGKTIKLKAARGEGAVEEEISRILKSEIPAKVVSIYVKEGAKVKKGDELMILESMKMENVIRAPFDSVVKDVKVKEGDMVLIGDPLIEFEGPTQP